MLRRSQAKDSSSDSLAPKLPTNFEATSRLVTASSSKSDPNGVSRMSIDSLDFAAVFHVFLLTVLRVYPLGCTWLMHVKSRFAIVADPDLLAAEYGVAKSDA